MEIGHCAETKSCKNPSNFVLWGNRFPRLHNKTLKFSNKSSETQFKVYMCLPAAVCGLLTGWQAAPQLFLQTVYMLLWWKCAELCRSSAAAISSWLKLHPGNNLHMLDGEQTASYGGYAALITELSAQLQHQGSLRQIKKKKKKRASWSLKMLQID